MKRGNRDRSTGIIVKYSDWTVREIEESSLCGCGGVDSPSGLKWSFMLEISDGHPCYLVVVADESELLHFYISTTAPTRLRYCRTLSSDRFLDVFSHPLPRSSLPGPTAFEAGDELHEEELFWIGGFVDPPNTGSVQNSLSRSCGVQGTSGILAALPESERRPGAHGRPMFNQKASSSRMIPAILKPTVERHVPVSAKYHQSAPVNVSVLSKAVRRAHEFNVDDSDDGAEGKCCRRTRSWRGVLSSHQYCPARFLKALGGC